MTAEMPSRGDIWIADLGSASHAVGHEQALTRPALVVSAEFVNRSVAGMAIVLPLTTAERPVGSRVRIDPPEGGLTEPSAIQCEQIRAVSSRRLHTYLGSVDDDTIAEVEYALKILLDLA